MSDDSTREQKIDLVRARFESFSREIEQQERARVMTRDSRDPDHRSLTHRTKRHDRPPRLRR